MPSQPLHPRGFKGSSDSGYFPAPAEFAAGEALADPGGVRGTGESLPFPASGIGHVLGLRPPAGEHIVGPLGQAPVVVLSAHDNKPFPCERGSRGPPAVIVNAS